MLVTGSNGLVGHAMQNISKKYKMYEYIFISSKDYNLELMEQTIAMFEKYKPDYVIHLAACVGGLYKNMNNKVEMLEKNIMINFNVVKCCHDYNVKKLISCLSTCIFPNDTTYPINEKMLHNGPPHNSNDTYSYAKRLMDIHCKAYRENFNDNFVSVIPTNVYGPYDNFNLIDGHVIPALIHACYLAKNNREKFIVKGSGIALRQFIYSDDLAELIMWTLLNYDGDSIILSVPEDKEVSIGTVASLIARCFNYEDEMIFDKQYSDGQYKKTANNEILMQQIKKIDFTEIDQGIKYTVNWFVENYNSLRK